MNGGRRHGGRGHGEPEIFGQFHIFGKFTKDHLADLSRLLGLISNGPIMDTKKCLICVNVKFFLYYKSWSSSELQK